MSFVIVEMSGIAVEALITPQLYDWFRASTLNSKIRPKALMVLGP